MSYGDRRMRDEEDEILFRVRISWDAYSYEYKGYGDNPPRTIKVEAGSRVYGPYTDLPVARRKRTSLVKEYNSVNCAEHHGNPRGTIEASIPVWKVVEE